MLSLDDFKWRQLKLQDKLWLNFLEPARPKDNDKPLVLSVEDSQSRFSILSWIEKSSEVNGDWKKRMFGKNL